MDIKETVAKARQECIDIFSSEFPEDIRLEEAFLDDANNWVITLSYVRQSTQSTMKTEIFTVEHESFFTNQRIYKIFTIKKSNAEVVSIKTRDLT